MRWTMASLSLVTKGPAMGTEDDRKATALRRSVKGIKFRIEAYRIFYIDC